jgi:diguanylate cyclase (GGDEF)-like protein
VYNHRSGEQRLQPAVVKETLMESQTWTLLVAEDNETEYARIEGWLAGRGQALLKQAPSYEAALELLLRNECTAALVDCGLGGRRGLDLIRAAIAKGCQVPCVALAETVDAAAEAAARAAGAADLLPMSEVTPLLLERSLRYAVDRAQLLTMVRTLTIYDELTGLYNLRHLKHLMREEINRSQRYGRHISLVLIDIDHFEEVNSAYGPQVGDEVLQHVAHFLRNRVRWLDRIGRYGGDEFAILVPETFSTEALEMTARLRGIVRAPFKLRTGTDETQIAVTLSLGVAELPGDADTADGLVEKAAEALKAAKERGGDGAVQYFALKDGAAKGA